jgi:hypothetical protein
MMVGIAVRFQQGPLWEDLGGELDVEIKFLQRNGADVV